MGRVAVELWGTPDRYAPGSKLCRYERPSRRQAHSVRRALSYLRADARAWNCVRRPIPGLGAGRFLSCRRGIIPREEAWAFCGLELSSAWGPVWCLTLWFLRNVARNSLTCISNIEITSLEFCGFLDA